MAVQIESRTFTLQPSGFTNVIKSTYDFDIMNFFWGSMRIHYVNYDVIL